MKLPVLLLLTLALAPAAYAERSGPVELGEFDTALRGHRTTILVLGTAHLSGWKEEVSRARLDEMLAPLLQRLVDYAPDTIAIENVSGADCDHLLRYGEAYAAATEYCWSSDVAQRATGLDRPTAERRILETLLRGGPGDEPGARRKLAALFLAAGDPNSALVQWLRLPSDERIADGMLDEALVEALERRAASLNESISIGVTLAVRLGHERVFPIDDHSADQLYLPLGEDFGDHMRLLWKGADTGGRASYEEHQARALESGDFIAFLRWLNEPETQRKTIKGDFAAAMADGDARRIGQGYARWWQVRNLRMVANLVAAAGLQDSHRTLSIVGASHQTYFRSYLAPMHHIELLDPVEFLAPAQARQQTAADAR